MRPQQNRTSRPAARNNRYRQGPRTRAGLVASQAMDFGVIENVEALLFEEGVTLAPMDCEGTANDASINRPGSVTVLPTAGVSDIENGKLAGMVVPGAEQGRSPEGDIQFDKLINAAHSENVPVMAFGEGVTRTLQAIGFETPSPTPPAMLIHRGVRILETPSDVRDAVRAFHGAQARAA